MASRGKRIVLGCAVGCGALLVLGMAGCFGFRWWVTHPGEALEPRRLLTADTTGYAEWTLSTEDPGTRAFVETLIEVSQQRPGQTGLPGWLDSALTRGQNRQNEESLKEILPLTAAWALGSGDQPGADRWVLGLGLKQLGNRVVFADWFMGLTLGKSGNPTSESYRSEKIYRMGDGGDAGITFFIVGNDLFFASDAIAARRAIDRLYDPAQAARPATELERRLAALPAEASLRAVVQNDQGELRRVLEMFPGQQPDPAVDWTAVRRVTLAGGFVEGTAFEGTLDFLCDDPEWRRSHQDSLAAALRVALGLDHLPIEFRTTSRADGIRVDLRVEDLPAFLQQL